MTASYFSPYLPISTMTDIIVFVIVWNLIGVATLFTITSPKANCRCGKVVEEIIPLKPLLRFMTRIAAKWSQEKYGTAMLMLAAIFQAVPVLGACELVRRFHLSRHGSRCLVYQMVLLERK